jgi:cardiolipin synthase
VLVDASSGPLFIGAAVVAALSAIGVLWPRCIAWPLAALGGWFSLNLGIRGWRQFKKHRRDRASSK